MLRNRIFAGRTQSSVWWGGENGVPPADSSPDELAPTSQQQLEWPKWGQFFETDGRVGEGPADPQAVELLKLYRQWRSATTDKARDAADHIPDAPGLRWDEGGARKPGRHDPARPGASIP